MDRTFKRQAIGRLFAIAATASIVFHGLPQGLFIGCTSHVPVANTCSVNCKPTAVFEHESELCLTPACQKAAFMFLNNLSPQYKELDPCEDFEEFVCGGRGPGISDILIKNSNKLVREILEAPYPKHSYSFFPIKSIDEENFDKMKNAYNACRRIDNKTTNERILKALERFNNSSPATAINSKHWIRDASRLLAEYGVTGLIQVDFGPDELNPETVAVFIDAPPDFDLPYEYEKWVENYRLDVIAKLSALYPHQDNSTFSAVVDLEKKLATTCPNEEDCWCPNEEDCWSITPPRHTYQKRPHSLYRIVFTLLKSLQKTYNPISMDEAEAIGLIGPVFELEQFLANQGVENTKIERVIVKAPKYFEELPVILAATPEDVIHYYFIWKVVQAFFLPIDVDTDVITSHHSFYNLLYPQQWRDDICVEIVQQGLGWILSRFYVDRAFTDETKSFGDTIITEIKTEFEKKLKAAEWMDEDATKKAVEKVYNTVHMLGYPTKSPNIMDPPTLKKYYEALDISSESFFDNWLAMGKFLVKKKWSAFGKPFDSDEWDTMSTEVNAYHDPIHNVIVFPAAIMQFPALDINLPAYISYGAFGAVAGHELSHGFDATRRHYDQNARKTNWWSKDVVEAFENKTECFVDQYSNFTIPALGPYVHVKGHFTLDENLVDANGLSIAFQAWKSRLGEKPDKSLRGLEHFTQEQMFFISFGNFFCSPGRNYTSIDQINTDVHAPDWARILGTTANSREFRESFHCKVKEPTCQIW
ncbi:Peptidase family M13 [Pyrenophora seminiperda CCB06]|uniref:Peptidase family M13 n=1 Tax=Pyrenophora seminiperda CCB06 TaxID=1302712 RepID=A0A3M7M977_9PLEO|nr:Peptidase family M13 [Pyrenophora seminiperda CCB06]